MVKEIYLLPENISNFNFENTVYPIRHLTYNFNLYFHKAKSIYNDGIQFYELLNEEKEITIINRKLKNIYKENNFSNILPKGSPLIMGILNVTPDSFYDGAKYFNKEKAVAHAYELLKDGADIIDVGGESTRPGAKPVTVEEECNRILPIIEELVKNNILVSCDTRNSLTMEKALDCGVKIINDVSGLNFDDKSIEVINKYDCLYILTHSKGLPANMQDSPYYSNAPADIYKFLAHKIKLLRSSGFSKNNIIIDPGIGFGKLDKHNFLILRYLSIFLDLGLPILVGLSRKSFIRRFVRNDEASMLPGSVAVAINAYMKGANILRVHDVRETKLAIEIFKKTNL